MNEIASELTFSDYIHALSNRYRAILTPIFETNAKGLYEAYLSGFSGEAVKYHTCSCCEAFINTYGHLATVDAEGRVQPVMWVEDEAPSHYAEAVAILAKLVKRAKIVKPFVSGLDMYGTTRSYTKSGFVWHHYAVKPGHHQVYVSKDLNANQRAAEQRENFKHVQVALTEFSPEAISVAQRILQDKQLPQSEVAVAQADFLAYLHSVRRQENLVWERVASSPNGFCHPRSSVIGSLLEDIQAGLSFEDIRRRWTHKMDPTKYQRAQVPPKAGAIEAAERGFERMGAGPALKRRYAGPADVLERLWEPQTGAFAPTHSSVFGSLKAKAKPAVEVATPPQTMTWDKFRKTILPEATRIEYLTVNGRRSIGVMTTALIPGSVPMLQWDKLEARNPVAYFQYQNGSFAHDFGFRNDVWVPVSFITTYPHQWNGGQYEHQGEGVMLVLEGAVDKQNANGQSAIFASNLVSEFHAYRSVIEAYSQANPLGDHHAQVCGPMLGPSSTGHAVLRVTRGSNISEFLIDRWD